MIVELFTERQKRLLGELVDVYQYEIIPHKLRHQIGYIIKDIFEYVDNYNVKDEHYEYTSKILLREWGERYLLSSFSGEEHSLLGFFYDKATNDQSLDLIDYCFRYIGIYMRSDATRFHNGVDYLTPEIIDKAINELNYRFRQNGVGYQFTEGLLTRIDSQMIHAEVTLPVLHLLSNESVYAGVNDEFRSAHKHYRESKYKEVMVDCLKAFESMMKAIHTKRGWDFEQHRSTAKALIDSCYTNNLIPPYLQQQFTSIRTILESGVPTLRNREGGHGQGAAVKEVPEHMASYILHLTATNLLFLAECEKALR